MNGSASRYSDFGCAVSFGKGVDKFKSLGVSFGSGNAIRGEELTLRSKQPGAEPGATEVDTDNIFLDAVGGLDESMGLFDRVVNCAANHYPIGSDAEGGGGFPGFCESAFSKDEGVSFWNCSEEIKVWARCGDGVWGVSAQSGAHDVEAEVNCIGDVGKVVAIGHGEAVV